MVGKVVDETIVEVIKLKGGKKKFMRKTTADSKQARRHYKILRELTQDEVDIMRELKTGDGNPFVPKFEEVIIKTAPTPEPKADVIVEDVPEVKEDKPEVKVTETNDPQPDVNKELEAAKVKATELKIKYRSNIGLETLNKKIAEVEDGNK